jgi:hypothetical protein
MTVIEHAPLTTSASKAHLDGLVDEGTNATAGAALIRSLA